MADRTPREAASELGISEATLRKHAREFADFLSPGAQGGPTARRRYQDSDITLLRRAAILLAAGQTYAQIRHHFGRVEAELGGRSPMGESSPIGENATRVENSTIVEAEVLQPSDQQQALAQLLEAQRQIVEAQRALIAQLQEAGEQQRQLVEHQAEQLDQARQQIEDMRAALARSRIEVELAQVVATDVQAEAEQERERWRRLPRWVRWWFGEGE